MSKELKSKKTGKISILSDEEYAAIVRHGVIDMRKFTVTDLRVRTIIPSLKTPVEVKEVKVTKKKKNEG